MTPQDALSQLERLAEGGTLGTWCAEQRISLLVAFGSSVDPGGSDRAGDLNLGVLFERGGDALSAVGALMDLVDYERVDVMDLRPAPPRSRPRSR